MRYTMIGDVWKEKYGEKIYKLSLSAGTTCPNRDGSRGWGGCIFCSERGSGDFAYDSSRDLKERIRKAKARVAGKGAKKFVAYFQSFTNTYGDLERLEELFAAAAREEDVMELSIATRCDCLGEDALRMLERVRRIKPVTVEIGLQSARKETLERINCLYTLEEYDSAVRTLKERGFPVVVHLILGFPWETKEDMVASARYVAQSGADGVKLQLLHVLRGTRMGADYIREPFRTLSMEEYTDILTDCVRVLPEDMVIHRLTGDGDKKLLLAPMWSRDKKKVLNAVTKRLREAER